MDNQYSEIYKKLSALKLLEIIDNSKDYKILAVEAAKLELENRKLDEQYISEIKNEIRLKKCEQQNIETETKKKQKEVVSKFVELSEYANPLIEKSPVKLITILVVLLSIIEIFKLVTNFSSIKYAFENIDLLFDLNILELIYLPITIFFLWRKSLIGWRMLFIWLLYNIVTTGILTYYVFQIQDITGPLANFIKTPSLSTCLLSLGFYIGLLYFINKRTIKPLFKINNEEAESIKALE